MATQTFTCQDWHCVAARYWRASNINFKARAEKGIQAGQIKNIIHPRLTDDVRREAIKCADELEAGILSFFVVLLRGRLSSRALAFLSSFNRCVKMKALGWAGTALIIIAYFPQIHHLFIAKCAWGISISTLLIWLLASILLLTYCMLRRDFLFAIVQSINIVAIFTTIILARRSNKICPYHLRTAQAGA